MPAFVRPVAGVLISVTLHLTGCAFESGPDATSSIYGPWRWVGSSGGIVGITPTPSDENIELIFYFHRGGRVSIYDGTTAPTRVPYTSTVDSPATDDPSERRPNERRLQYAHPLTVFPFDPEVDRHIVRRVGPDTLILADPCCHRYEHTFIRIE